jgi:hypothetical protein
MQLIFLRIRERQQKEHSLLIESMQGSTSLLLLYMEIDVLYNDAVKLLKNLIRIPSFSKDEGQTAELIENFFTERNIPSNRYLNNVWAVNRYYDESKPSVLLNSHHDTVRPNVGYTRDPFEPAIEDGKLFGLGSNDAGGPLVSLIAAFLHFYDEPNLPFNVVSLVPQKKRSPAKTELKRCSLTFPHWRPQLSVSPLSPNSQWQRKASWCWTVWQKAARAMRQGMKAKMLFIKR